MRHRRERGLRQRSECASEKKSVGLRVGRVVGKGSQVSQMRVVTGSGGFGWGKCRKGFLV